TPSSSVTSRADTLITTGQCWRALIGPSGRTWRCGMRARVRAVVFGASFSAVAVAGCQTPDPPARPMSPPAILGAAPVTGTTGAATAVTPAVAALPGSAPGGVVPAAGAAVPSGPLTVADLEQLALAHNPTLIQAAAFVDAARGKALQAGLPFNPVVGME